MDGIPIREFKNYKKDGVDYPWRPMQIEASICNADWAGVVDLSQAPLITHYEGFNFNAWPAQINVFHNVIRKSIFGTNSGSTIMRREKQC